MGESHKSLLAKLRKRFSGKPRQLRSDMDWTEGNALTPGGKLFREWLKNRVDEDNNVNQSQQQQAAQVTNPTNPKDAQRRQQVQKITSGLMLKNKQLIPGKVKDASVVLNAMRNDPNLAKMDTDTQQDVTNFFLSPAPG